MDYNETTESNTATENQRQNEYIKKIRMRNETLQKETGKGLTFYNFVMGCQMNAHDSEKLSGMLTEMGYVETKEEKEADFIIYNTCCVRENAELKVYGKLGWLKHYKETRPDVIIALCGCMMQQDVVIQTIKKSHKHVDIVFGTFNLYKLPELIWTRLTTGETVFDIWQEQKEIIEDLPSIRQYPYKASVNIMYGCNNFCSYCIVPYVRGRERSREAADILSEIKGLIADGVKEVTLLGQNVNSYGKNLTPPVSFAALLRKVDQIDGLERIRFMTSHPKDISDELIQALAECKKTGKYLHLPFQSGSTAILEKMNRRYTKERYLQIIEKVKKAVPDIHISTDIIVGFPGETEEDFQDTLDVVKKVKFSTAFTFIYSKRTGTPAAVMENQIPEDIIKDRFNRLLDVLNPLIHELNSQQVGNTFNVLVEETSKHDEALLSGRSENNTLIHFKGTPDLIGQIVPVKIIENKTFYLIGERV